MYWILQWFLDSAAFSMFLFSMKPTVDWKFFKKSGSIRIQQREITIALVTYNSVNQE